MTIAQARQQQTALEGLIRAFEDAFVQSAASSPQINFEPVLVIDMRFGMFHAFVLSVRSDGNLHSIPRPIKVEEADGIYPARALIPLYAYRKKKTQNWVMCTAGRLNQKSSEGNFDVAENVFEYTLTLPEKEQAGTFERLWSAFLSSLVETDSGQDYKRVVFVVDNASSVSLIQAALPKVGARLDKGGSKWQSAFVVCIDAAVDLQGYAFLNKPHDLSTSNALYLLLLGPSMALAVEFNGSGFQYDQVHHADVASFSKIAAIGITSTIDHPDVLLYGDDSKFKKACLIGYLHWWLQIDEKRLDELRQKVTLLEAQLAAARIETDSMQMLVDRLRNVLHQLNRI